MKLSKTRAALYLAQVQAKSWAAAAPGDRLSFERATLWYLNQAQDALVNAVREHHGLRGEGDEVATQQMLAQRDLPSALWDEVMAFEPWWACRRSLAVWPRQSNELSLNSDEDTRTASAAAEGFVPWVQAFSALLDELEQSYAEF